MSGEYNFTPRLCLLEWDTRFSVLPEFVKYDYQDPMNLPGIAHLSQKFKSYAIWQVVEDLKGQFDRIICDPPFLNEDCQTKGMDQCQCKDAWTPCADNSMHSCDDSQMAVKASKARKRISAAKIHRLHWWENGDSCSQSVSKHADDVIWTSTCPRPACERIPMLCKLQKRFLDSAMNILVWLSWSLYIMGGFGWRIDHVHLCNYTPEVELHRTFVINTTIGLPKCGTNKSSLGLRPWIENSTYCTPNMILFAITSWQVASMINNI